LKRLVSLSLAAMLFPAAPGFSQPTDTIFGSATPGTPAETSDTAGVTLGVQFQSAQSGSVTAIRFYRGAASANGYTVALYDGSGNQLGTAQVSSDTCTVPCWESVNLPAAISISANATYVAAYYTGHGAYADDINGLTSAVSNPPLAALAQGGVYAYGAAIGFPSQTWNASNYWVDIVFSPQAPLPGYGIVQKAMTPDSNAAGLSLTVPLIAVQNGDSLMGAVTFGDNNGQTPTISVADSAGHPLVVAKTVRDPAGTQSVAAFYETNVSGSPTGVTITFNPSAAWNRAEVVEVAGAGGFDGAVARLQTNVAAGSDVISSGAVSPSAAGDFIYGFAASTSMGGATIAAGGGYTLANNGSGANYNPMADEWQSPGTASPLAATFSTTASGADWIAGALAFKGQASCPALSLTFGPAQPSIPADAGGGTVVSTVAATCSDGTPFTGSLEFSGPYYDDSGVFALSGSNLVVNPAGPGLGNDAGTTQSVSITARQ
jgi:hypothetical protein